MKNNDNNNEINTNHIYVLKNIGSDNATLIQLTPVQLLIYKLKNNNNANFYQTNLNNLSSYVKPTKFNIKLDGKDISQNNDSTKLDIHYLKNILNMLFSFYKPRIKEFISIISLR